MNNLSITTIQSDLHWEDKVKNLEMFAAKIASAADTDLIILPEMFTTGFSMRPELFAEKMDGATVSWMRYRAKEKNCVITGSFMCEDGGKYFNRLVWMRPDGTYETYDKRHLFRMGEEDKYYAAGQKRIIVELKGWKVCPLVCYDLRFPVWSRNKKTESGSKTQEPGQKKEGKLEYDLLIYVANWPERRIFPWKSLLVARAIENQSYVVGLNRTGNDAAEVYHSGDSLVLDFRGETINKTETKKESVETVSLNYEELIAFRKMFPVMLDADDFEIK